MLSFLFFLFLFPFSFLLTSKKARLLFTHKTKPYYKPLQALKHVETLLWLARVFGNICIAKDSELTFAVERHVLDLVQEGDTQLKEGSLQGFCLPSLQSHGVNTTPNRGIRR